MKLVTFLEEGHEQLGVLINGTVYNMDVLHPDLPGSMNMFLNYWEDMFPFAQAGELMLREGTRSSNKGVPLGELELLSPVPFPNSLRKGFAFRNHAEALWRSKGAELPSAFDQFPVFSFSNHHSTQGPGNIFCMPDHFEKLDFGLEVAVVISKHGKNISAAEADDYIGGLMIMNGMSARRLQEEEMQLSNSSAKGNDFCTAFGPWLVTPDELENLEIPAKENHMGKCWNLPMKVYVNGELISEANLGDMDWTFAEIIERASYGVDLYPGDVIGSGPAGKGCFLELNGTSKLSSPEYSEQWLQNGDVADIEIDGLGKLSNTIAAEETEYSILAKKKF